MNGPVTITVEVPESLLELVGPKETVAERLREALVMELVREERISRGKAAELLGISMWDMHDLIGKYQILSGPTTAEELEHEIANARRASESVNHAGRI